MSLELVFNIFNVLLNCLGVTVLVCLYFLGVVIMTGLTFNLCKAFVDKFLLK